MAANLPSRKCSGVDVEVRLPVAETGEERGFRTCHSAATKVCDERCRIASGIGQIEHIPCARSRFAQIIQVNQFVMLGAPAPAAFAPRLLRRRM